MILLKICCFITTQLNLISIKKQVLKLKINLMKKISNAYTKMNRAEEEFHCFGCSPFNKTGLKLKFIEVEDFMTCTWKPEKRFEGFINVLHGGIQATLMDEIASWVVCVKCKTSGFTTDLAVKYKKPVFINGGEITLKARLTEQNRRLATIHVELLNREGELCSEADVRYMVYPETIAREKFMYPGADAFYENEK